MPIDVEGTPYLTAADVIKELKITRQTLWRWRLDGKVPLGRRYRSKQILFTARDVEELRRYANRVEPINPAPEGQMPLFEPPTSKRKN